MDIRLTDGADISPCGQYRWSLTRDLGLAGEGICTFIMLNPSTADGNTDDPTVRRCKGFAAAWGFQGLAIVNLFSWRATHPIDLKAAKDPIGEHTADAIGDALFTSGLVVCAWGVHGGYLDRDLEVLRMIETAHMSPHCLGVSKDGFPLHPLYQPLHREPITYPGRK